MTWLVPLLGRRLVRLLWLLPLAAVGLFTLVSLAPIDPIQAHIGTHAALVGPEQREAIAATWGLDRPAPERFVAWVEGLANGDLGRSLTFGAPVLTVIAERFPASLLLIGSAFALSFVLGTGLGIAAAATRGGPLDRAIRGLAIVLLASPGFWIAILLVAFLAIGLGWFPSCCAAPPGLTAAETSLFDRLRHLVLPVLTLSLIGTAPLVLHTRQRLVAFLDGPAATHLRAHGLSRRTIAFGPGLRHGLGPALTLHLAGAGELFGGSVLAETVFAWPGLGQATVRAATGADAPLLMGIGLATILFVFVGNLFADVAARLVDPRLRASAA